MDNWANGHKWPCTNFYHGAEDQFPCICDPEEVVARAMSGDEDTIRRVVAAVRTQRKIKAGGEG